MHDDLFPMLEPPPGAVLRLRATLWRRTLRRRWRRAALGVAVVCAAALAISRGAPDRGDARSPEVAVFDAALHPALAGDSVLPPLTPRGDSSPLFRRPTLDANVVLYELGP